MADVEMTDAPPKAKAPKADTADSGKKRFEVKKVNSHAARALVQRLTHVTVERRRSVGVGHCRRQLRHLPQPHHGPVYASSLS